MEPFTNVFRPILPKPIGHLMPLSAFGVKPVIRLKNGRNGRNRWGRMMPMLWGPR